MKTTTKIKLHFAVFVVLISLAHFSSYSQTQPNSSLFPLSLGNKWIYESTDHTYSDTTTVVDTQSVDGKLYYAVKENSNLYNWFRLDNNEVYIVDTAAVHLDPSNLKEFLLYDFSTDIGTKWFVPVKNYNIYCDYADTISLISKNDVITTQLEVFSNCYCFLHQLPCRDYGRYKEWFAEGVGRVSYKRETIHGLEDLVLTHSNIITYIPEYDNLYSIKLHVILQNYPNPFNPTTTISWYSPVSGQQTLKIYDILGNEITTLVNEFKPAGNYEVMFDGSNFPSGVYYYRLQSGKFTVTKKLVLLR